MPIDRRALCNFRRKHPWLALTRPPRVKPSSGAEPPVVDCNNYDIRFFKDEDLEDPVNIAEGIDYPEETIYAVVFDNISQKYVNGITWESEFSGDLKLAAVDYSADRILTSDNGSTDWSFVTVPVTGGLIDITSSADGMILAAVDSTSLVWISDNGGTTWTSRDPQATYPVPIDPDFSAITSSADGMKLVALSSTEDESSSIWISDDRGESWLRPLTLQREGDERVLVDITSSADGMKLAAVQWYDIILTSDDGGLTWTPRGPLKDDGSIDERFLVNITSSADGMKLAVTELALSGGGGGIWTSNDGGVNWEKAANIDNKYWAGITSSADGTKLAAVEGLSANTGGKKGSTPPAGSIWTSADGGVKWKKAANTDNKTWLSITSSADGAKLVATQASTEIGSTEIGSTVFWTSDDSGNTWNVNAEVPNAGLAAITSSSGVWGQETMAGPEKTKKAFKLGGVGQLGTAVLTAQIAGCSDLTENIEFSRCGTALAAHQAVIRAQARLETINPALVPFSSSNLRDALVSAFAVANLNLAAGRTIENILTQLTTFEEYTLPITNVTMQIVYLAALPTMILLETQLDQLIKVRNETEELYNRRRPIRADEIAEIEIEILEINGGGFAAGGNAAAAAVATVRRLIDKINAINAEQLSDDEELAAFLEGSRATEFEIRRELEKPALKVTLVSDFDAISKWASDNSHGTFGTPNDTVGIITALFTECVQQYTGYALSIGETSPFPPGGGYVISPQSINAVLGITKYKGPDTTKAPYNGYVGPRDYNEAALQELVDFFIAEGANGGLNFKQYGPDSTAYSITDRETDDPGLSYSSLSQEFVKLRETKFYLPIYEGVLGTFPLTIEDIEYLTIDLVNDTSPREDKNIFLNVYFERLDADGSVPRLEYYLGQGGLVGVDWQNPDEGSDRNGDKVTTLPAVKTLYGEVKAQKITSIFISTSTTTGSSRPPELDITLFNASLKVNDCDKPFNIAFTKNDDPVIITSGRTSTVEISESTLYETTVAGGQAPYKYSVSLEDLEIDENTGVITAAEGLTVGEYSFTVTVRDDDGIAATQDVTLTVFVEAIVPFVEKLGVEILGSGFERYRLSVTLGPNASNIYTIFGTADSPMRLPPAYQVAAPFGVNTGGVNPAISSIFADDAAYDSWLTVGITDGDTAGSLSSIGIDWLAWTETNGVTIDNGAVFWMNPDDGPGGEVVIAQITVPVGDPFVFRCGMQGRSSAGEDWMVENVVFNDTMAAPILLEITSGSQGSDLLEANALVGTVVYETDVVGGQAPYTYSVSGGFNIDAGVVTFDQDYTAGEYSFTVTVRDYDGIKATQNVTLTVLVDTPLTFEEYTNDAGVEEYRVSKCETSAEGHLIIPLTYKNIPVTAIGDSAFENCDGLTSVTIPGSVKTISASAFKKCKELTEVTITKGVVTIGGSAFKECSALASVRIPSSVKTIAANAFVFCGGLKSVTIKEGVKTIAANAFKGCYGLKSVTIPGSVETIAANAFKGCYGLKSVTIKEGVKTIGAGAFDGCFSPVFTGVLDFEYGTVTIPGSVETIAANAFKGCTILTEIIFKGAAPTTVGVDAFADVDVEVITIVYVKAEFKNGFVLTNGRWNGLRIRVRVGE